MNYTKFNLSLYALIISVLWFAVSFIFNEDSLGGALHDFKYHEKYFFDFSQNFTKTINEYGVNNEVRNSPVFYILLSKLYQFGITSDYLKYFNLIIILPLVLYFNKCINLSFEQPDKNSKFFLTSCLFLSPTIRSLINYPYPLIWAICFFLISIYFFLKFKKKNEFKRSNGLFCIFYLSIASYFTPNFAVFIIFYFYHFYLDLKISKNLILFISLAFILSLPAFAFLIWKDFYLFKNNVFEISSFEKMNFSNKIIIISSFIIFFFIPFFKKIDLSFNTIKRIITDKNFYFINFLIIICLFYFDYRDGAGGGFFYKLSIIIFENHVLIFFVFIFSILFFYLSNLLNKNNIIIFTILILYNLQYSIYYKYYDPILLFIFLFLMKTQRNDVINLNKVSTNCFLFYLVFLCMNIFKKNFLAFLTI